ncbi:MAG: NUDIX hydrolase [Candidatus Colwellbacteria bacterium]|nr:NUDIX hydrolase [Candidatus Colwellbacteria bacterium]
MSITANYKDKDGEEYVFEYFDSDSFDNLDYSLCKQTYGVCFYNNKMVIGFGGKKDGWGLIGGTIEKGETFEQTLKREIQEESNMEVLGFLPIGYQKVISPKDQSYIYQLRFVCTVRPYGPFISDPDDSIKEIKLIDPMDYKKYFDWGEIGERIVSRALKLKDKIVV